MSCQFACLSDEDQTLCISLPTKFEVLSSSRARLRSCGRIFWPTQTTMMSSWPSHILRAEEEHFAGRGRKQQGQQHFRVSLRIVFNLQQHLREIMSGRGRGGRGGRGGAGGTLVQSFGMAKQTSGSVQAGRLAQQLFSGSGIVPLHSDDRFVIRTSGRYNYEKAICAGRARRNRWIRRYSFVNAALVATSTGFYVAIFGSLNQG